MMMGGRWERRGPLSSGPRVHNIADGICLPSAVAKHVVLSDAQPPIMPYGHDQQHDGRQAS